MRRLEPKEDKAARREAARVAVITPHKRETEVTVALLREHERQQARAGLQIFQFNGSQYLTIREMSEK